MAGRLDLLRLRYFWKLYHSDTNNICYRVFEYRKKRFLGSNHGFLHDVLSLCCKYDIINVWNGKLGFNLCPKGFFKKTVLAFNLKKDLKAGSRKPCGFADVYLRNVFLYQEAYHLIKPFKTFNFFSSVGARSLIVRVLLHPRVFMVDCHFCDGKFKHIFNHYVHHCKNLRSIRQDLRNKLKFYNFPHSCILKEEKFLSCCLEKIVWTKCLTEFLDKASF